MRLSPAEFIAEKRDGREHPAEDLREWIDGFLSGRVPDYQVAPWLMAVFFRGMTPRETVAWTRLVAGSGRTIPGKGAPFRIDKHSTGGVGDKTSLLLVPLVASVAKHRLGAGAVEIPMVSGRGLGTTGGTLDKLESVPGFRSDLSLERAAELLASQGYCMMGQTADFAPADRYLYALRDVTATVESLPLICGSILGKKIAEGLDGLVIDVKTGNGAFMRTDSEARSLARSLQKVARECGVDTVALLTSMDTPLGFTVGNALEVVECFDYLSGRRRHPELHAITLELAAWMLRLSTRRQLTIDEARSWCEAELATDRPLHLWRELFSAQGGDWEAFERKRDEENARLTRWIVRAPAAGHFRCRALPLGRLLNRLGGGRWTKESTIDPWVGIEVARREGEWVEAGAQLLTVFHRPTISEEERRWVTSCLEDAVAVEPAGASAAYGCGVKECIE